MKKDIGKILEYNDFVNEYINNFTSVYNLIDNTDGFKIKKLTSDIEFIIIRMELCLDKIIDLSNKFQNNYDENIMNELTELIYLFVSYSYSILCINKDELNTKFPINDFEKKQQKIFNDSSNKFIIHVLRNSMHHGDFYMVSGCLKSIEGLQNFISR